MSTITTFGDIKHDREKKDDFISLPDGRRLSFWDLG